MATPPKKAQEDDPREKPKPPLTSAEQVAKELAGKSVVTLTDALPHATNQVADLRQRNRHAAIVCLGFSATYVVIGMLLFYIGLTRHSFSIVTFPFLLCFPGILIATHGVSTKPADKLVLTHQSEPAQLPLVYIRMITHPAEALEYLGDTRHTSYSSHYRNDSR